MPFYEYKCLNCRIVKEVYLQAPPPESVDCYVCMNSEDYPDEGNESMKRVWSSPGIGVVEGAGGSPARPPSKGKS